jgi:hypothetical protein
MAAGFRWCDIQGKRPSSQFQAAGCLGQADQVKGPKWFASCHNRQHCEFGHCRQHFGHYGARASRPHSWRDSIGLAFENKCQVRLWFIVFARPTSRFGLAR